MVVLGKELAHSRSGARRNMFSHFCEMVLDIFSKQVFFDHFLPTLLELIAVSQGALVALLPLSWHRPLLSVSLSMSASSLFVPQDDCSDVRVRVGNRVFPGWCGPAEVPHYSPYR